MSREIFGQVAVQDELPYDRVEVGPTNIELVQLNSIHEVAQYRAEYDQGGIEELARSMIRDHDNLVSGVELDDYQMVTEALDLGTPLIVNRIERAHIDAFLNDHAAHYDTVPEQILFDAESDTVDVSGSGHRRRRALLHIAKQYGFDSDRIYVQSAVYCNLSFEEMLGKQFRENISERPPRIDEANSIARYYRQKVRAGQKPTYKSVANFYCVDEKVVSRALAFASLPDEVRIYAERDILPFNLVARFRQLSEAYTSLYSTKVAHGETQEDYVKNELLVMANRLTKHRFDGDPVKKLDTILSAALDSVYTQMGGTQGELFFVVQEPASTRRAKGVNQAAARAIEFLQMLETQDELNNENRTKLQNILATRAIAADTESAISLF